MAITGTVPLSYMQAAIEAVAGTDLAATRKQPILGGTLTEHYERTKIMEQRGSLIRNYRSIQTKRWCEISGMEVAPTFQDLGWFMRLAAQGKASSSGTPTAVTAFRYDFQPTVATDDLKTATLEVGDTTQEWDVNFAVINRLEFGWSVGGVATLSCDWLGQKATASSYTSNLSDRVTEDINGALAKVYIDSTTIGSTQVYNVLDYRFVLDNHYAQFWAADGGIFSRDVYRTEPRSAQVEATLAFIDTTEYLTFTGDTSRKMRTRVLGSAGLHVVKFSGESHYDATAGADWKVSVITDVSTLA